MDVSAQATLEARLFEILLSTVSGNRRSPRLLWSWCPLPTAGICSSFLLRESRPQVCGRGWSRTEVRHSV